MNLFVFKAKSMYNALKGKNMKKEVFIIVQNEVEAETKAEYLVADDDSYNSYYEVQLDGYFPSRDAAQDAIDKKISRYKEDEAEYRDPKNQVHPDNLKRVLDGQEKMKSAKIARVTVSVIVEEIS